jgi:hypothetical protein
MPMAAASASRDASVVAVLNSRFHNLNATMLRHTSSARHELLAAAGVVVAEPRFDVTKTPPIDSAPSS